MPSPLTFGVEFEFALAVVLDERFPLPDPSETRCIRFVRTEGDTKDVYGVVDKPSWAFKDPTRVRQISNRTAAIRHIGNTLKEVGLPVNLNNLHVRDTTKWEVTFDNSTGPPDDAGGWDWVEIEVKSLMSSARIL